MMLRVEPPLNWTRISFLISRTGSIVRQSQLGEELANDEMSDHLLPATAHAYPGAVETPGRVLEIETYPFHARKIWLVGGRRDPANGHRWECQEVVCHGQARNLLDGIGSVTRKERDAQVNETGKRLNKRHEDDMAVAVKATVKSLRSYCFNEAVLGSSAFCWAFDLFAAGAFFT
jgi:hypothetical protein